MSNKTLFTIGFTKKSAREFFSKLKDAGVTTLIDIRLSNMSQFAGFTKKDDLIYFLKEICGCDYKHMPALAPTKEIMDAYKQKHIAWDEYVKQFTRLMTDRAIERKISGRELNNACLLCSESTPDRCHRRLVAEYFKEKFKDVSIKHL